MSVRPVHGPLLAGAVLLVLSAASPLPAAKDLRWKFQEGETLKFSLAQTIASQTSVEGKPVETKVDLLMELTWTVASVDPQGAAQIVQTLDRIKMTLEAPGAAALAYDSQ